MRTSTFSFLLLSALLIFLTGQSCTTYQPFFDDPDGPYAYPANRDRSDSVKHTVYLLGDAGNQKLAPQMANFTLLGHQLKQEDEHATLVILGDNIYPSGMPEEGAPDRALSEQIIRAQLDLVKDFAGKLYIIPGNHDWNHWSAGGREAVIRQAEFVEAYLDNDDIFYPEDGCGDPKPIMLEDDLALILLDSQWFLHDWEKEPDINKGCKVDTRQEFEARLREILDEYDDGDFIFAMHHPIYSAGPHGGYHTLKDHLFPLTRAFNNLYLPLPGIGSLYPTLRYLGISDQDIPHPQNMQWKDILLDATFNSGHVVFASGHEHSLQYFQDKREFAITDIVKSSRHYVVSGAGSKRTYISKDAGAEFAYAGMGFARLQYYHNGEVWLEFWRPMAGKEDGELMYRRRIKEKSLQVSEIKDQPFVAPPIQKEVADPAYAAGRGQRSWLGDLHRDAWTAEIPFPTLDLTEIHGGLTPLQKGGGIQTRSLRLENPEGRQYTLRSVNKDVALLLPDFVRNTVLHAFAQDALAMSHPYGAWVVPPLADAAGVYHTKPRFYYVPKQAALGDFEAYFGDQLYLLEERPAKNWEDNPSFGYAKDIESTRKVLREIRDSYENRVDQPEVLRARLFDIWLGDWDRHDDQWRWAEFKEGDVTRYHPIPRDRDQVFLAVDGIIPWFASRKWAARMFQHFDYDIRDIQGLCFNARYFDRTFLTEMNREDWITMAGELQGRLSDSIIEASIRLWPDTLFQLSGPEIIDKLKVRRDKLPQFAAEYYGYLAKEVEIWGTDKAERFVIGSLPEGRLKLSVHDLDSEGDPKKPYYARTFLPEETQEIRLYGFKDDDEFFFEGTSPRRIKVRVIGGQGEDMVKPAEVHRGKKALIYDTREGNSISWGPGLRDKTTLDQSANVYERKAFTLNNTLPLIVPGWNVDDGFTLGAGFIATTHGFRKKPYKSKHSFLARYAFATQALQASYSWDQVGVFGSGDFFLDTKAFAPTHVRNYFGLGNGTPYSDQDDDEFDFNRLRQSGILVNPSFKQTFSADRHTFLVGPIYEYTEIERTEGRFIAEDPARVDSDFDPKHYAGLQAQLLIDARDNGIIPKRGFKWDLRGGWKTNLEEENSFTFLHTDLALYHYTHQPVPIVWATRVGYQQNWGTYEFFQAPTLGRRNNLRAYRGERFAGDAAFFHNTDIRVGLASARNYFLPMDIGVIGFFDHGRVWLEGEDNDDWHVGYGGGLLLRPYETLVLSLTYSLSKEFNIFEFKVGFAF